MITREQAKRLLRQYHKATDDPIIDGLCARWQTEDDRAVQWAAFVQGALYALGRYSIADLEMHTYEASAK